MQGEWENLCICGRISQDPTQQKAHGDQEEPPRFSHKVIRSFRTSTERQVFEAVQINNIKCDQILNSKAEYRHNALVRQTIEFRGEIWEQEETLAADSCQKERGPQIPNNQGDGEEFGDQFYQRKLGKRKAKRQMDRDVDVTNTNIGSPQQAETPGIDSEEPGTNTASRENMPLPDGGTEPKTHGELYVKGRKIENLKRSRKRVKLSVDFNPNTTQRTSTSS